MTARKRILALTAAVGIALPLFAAAPASAAHITERGIENACPAGEVSDNQFSDVRDDNLFERNINCLADYGVSVGFPDGTYRPLDLNLRRQMATFIYRVGTLAGITWDTSDAGFSDVAQATANNPEQRDAINALANAGVAVGFPDGTYRPNDFITRDQMASFIARLQEAIADANPGYTFGPADDDYFDDDNGNIHEDNINLLAEEGVTVGRGGRNYEPRGFVLRQQMAGFLTRKLDILVEAGVVDSVYEDEATPTNTNTASGSAVTGIFDALLGLFR